MSYFNFNGPILDEITSCKRCKIFIKLINFVIYISL